MDVKLSPDSFSRFQIRIPHSRFDFESGVEHLNESLSNFNGNKYEIFSGIPNYIVLGIKFTK